MYAGQEQRKFARRKDGAQATERLTHIDYNRELQAVAKFSHHNYEACFVKSFGWYESPEAIFITMEYLPCGDLHTYLSKRKSTLPPIEVQQIAYQILEGLQFMHINDFAHRDIKPGNVLIKSCPPEDWWIKLADFGISKRAEDGSGPSTIKGTRGFMAPELQGFVDDTHDERNLDFQAADMWALGEIVFLMLNGEHAFPKPRAFMEYCTRPDTGLSTRLLPLAGESAAEFVAKLMTVQPQARITASDALDHPWMAPFRADVRETGQSTIAHPDTSSATIDRAHVRGESPSRLVTEASARWSDLDETGYNAFATMLVSESSGSTITPDRRRFRQSVLAGHSQSNESPIEGPRALEQGYERTSQTQARVAGDRFASTQATSTALASHDVSNEHHQSQGDSERRAVQTSSQGTVASSFSESKREWSAWLTLERRFGWRGYSGGHKDLVNAVAFSPNSKALASASHDLTIRLWGAQSGTTLQVLEGHNDAVNAIAFSPDGKTLASASHDHIVGLWDTRPGAALQVLEGHRSRVEAVTFSPDGKALASASFDRTVRLWDTRSRMTLQVLRGHEHYVNAIGFSPDGEMLASASHDRTVRLWDGRSGAALQQVLEGHTDWVTAVAFSPDGKMLASASIDKTVRLWDRRSRMTLQVLRGHEHYVNAIGFSPDGKTLASASADKTVRVWDGRSGAPVQQVLEGHEGRVTAVAFSPDGKTLASASHDKTVRLWT